MSCQRAQDVVERLADKHDRLTFALRFLQRFDRLFSQASFQNVLEIFFPE